MNHRVRSAQLFSFASALLVLFVSNTLFAQARDFHTQRIILDDGATPPHTFTLQIPTLTSNQSFTLPTVGLTWPTTNAIGVLTNDGSGALSWGAGGGGGSYLPLSGGTMTGAIAGLQASGDISLGKHIATTSTIVSAGVGDGTQILSSSVSAFGSDVAGRVIFTYTNTGAGNGTAKITFGTPYSSAPIVVITPVNNPAANLLPWITSTTTDFTFNIPASQGVQTGATYNYIVIQP